MEALLRAVAQQIKTKYNYPIHLRDIEGIQRPSFFIYCCSNSEEDHNKYAVKQELGIRIVYFAPYLKGKLPDRLDQEETMEALQSLFSISSLDAGEDTLHILKRSVGCTKATLNEPTVDAFLELQMEQIKDRVINEEASELINEVQINLLNNNDMEEK